VAGNTSDTLITVVGGSGFVGAQLVRSLAKRGYRIRVACRRPDLAGHVVVQGVPGQIVPVQANVRYPASLAAACEGADVVINVTGVLFSAGAQSFDAVHVFGASAVAKAAKAAKASQFIHFSALGASVESASAYATSRAEGEKAASAAFPGAMIVRPSIIFGPEDNFFNQFAKMARFSPVLPLIGGGTTKFQPVFVGDVAEAVASLVDARLTNGKTYELGGPEVMSFKQILTYILATTQRRRILLPIPFGVAKLIGLSSSILAKASLGLLGAPLLTMDQVEMLKKDNVVSPEAEAQGRSLSGLGITGRSVEAIVPGYLYRFRKAGQFSVPNAKPE
jgi:uncharacterized protein YbjT (DUF2867 family)